ncbi:MAG: hypothetical protein LBD25_02195 [Coriobacteriales bacterium]|jgi:hypothetical protein|nr:hypothetical protein [Coriobacteriales bacterium]
MARRGEVALRARGKAGKAAALVTALLLVLAQAVFAPASACADDAAPAGNGPRPLWSRAVGSYDNDNFTTVAAASDGGCLLAGTFSSASVSLGEHDFGDADGFVSGVGLVRLDAWGDFIWARGINSLDARFTHVAPTADGGFVAVGSTFGPSTNLGAHDWGHEGLTDGIVVKLTASGAVEWPRNYGGPSFEGFGSVAVLPDGGLPRCRGHERPEHQPRSAELGRDARRQ